jgi:recombination protein RecA
MAKQKQEENKEEKLSEQVKKSVASDKKKKPQPPKPPEGNFANVISTGSTLLDLAISGGKVRGGGIPSGIIIEEYGPASIGKTALLLSLAANIEKKGGEAPFQEPEARLSRGFAKVFGYYLEKNKIYRPDTVPEMFDNMYKWKPKNPKAVNGMMIDSLAAFASDLEIKNRDKPASQKKKDEYYRVAKQFSQALRTYARYIEEKDYIFACSNQLRDVMDPGFGEKQKSTGGNAFKYYGSLRLKAEKSPTKRLYDGQNPGYKIWAKRTDKFGTEREESIGTSLIVTVDKSSVWKPFRTAPVFIIWDYGIDNIRANLQYVKDVTKENAYYVKDTKLSRSLEEAITLVEGNDLEEELQEQVIDLWEEIDRLFQTKRKPKK